MEIKVISTGSKGNAVLINRNILVDCGVPLKKLNGIKKDLKLVLLTHIHSDHFNPATVRALTVERPTLRFACCEWMVEPLVNAGVSKKNIDVLYVGGLVMYYPGFVDALEPVNLVHDVPNCGWKLNINGERVFYATDTASLDGIEAPGYDWYLIEANYTETDIEQRIAAKMEAGQYCYETRAREVHMSREQAISWLAENMGPSSRYMFLHQHKED